MSSLSSIYLYLSIYESNHIRLYLSKRIYPSICLSLWSCIHTYLPIYLSIYLYIYLSIHTNLPICLCVHLSTPIDLSIYLTLTPMRLCMSVCRCDHVSTPIYLSIYLSIHPHKSTYHSVCPSFPTHLSIYLSISRLHLCVCACLSIHSFIYLAAAYPCIILLSIYVPIHYRSTYVSVHPSRHRPNNPFLCVLSMHPHQCTYSPLRVCLSISIGSSPTTHASMISIGSVTDCSERSKLAIPTLVTWGPRVGTGSLMRALPVTDWHTATERRCCSPPPLLLPRVRMTRCVPALWTRSTRPGRTHRAGTGCVEVTPGRVQIAARRPQF